MSEAYDWKVVPYPDEEKLNEVILLSEVNGWKVHYIDLNEYKIILKKPKVERLDG
tara:strand:+ start:111 stop:275 length:165 start_codon:yes stop_codon:yes gene_type:complete